MFIIRVCHIYPSHSSFILLSPNFLWKYFTTKEVPFLLSYLKIETSPLSLIIAACMCGLIYWIFGSCQWLYSWRKMSPLLQQTPTTNNSLAMGTSGPSTYPCWLWSCADLLITMALSFHESSVHVVFRRQHFLASLIILLQPLYSPWFCDIQVFREADVEIQFRAKDSIITYS